MGNGILNTLALLVLLALTNLGQSSQEDSQEQNLELEILQSYVADTAGKLHGNLIFVFLCISFQDSHVKVRVRGTISVDSYSHSVWKTYS